MAHQAKQLRFQSVIQPEKADFAPECLQSKLNLRQAMPSLSINNDDLRRLSISINAEQLARQNQLPRQLQPMRRQLKQLNKLLAISDAQCLRLNAVLPLLQQNYV